MCLQPVLERGDPRDSRADPRYAGLADPSCRLRNAEGHWSPRSSLLERNHRSGGRAGRKVLIVAHATPARPVKYLDP